MRFIKISNDIFNYKLSPKAFIVYCGLSSKVNALQYTIIKRENLADMCNLSLATLDKAINELVKNNLVHKKNRFGSVGYKANAYFVTNIIKNNQNWFKLNLNIFNQNLSSVDFLIYCFIFKCMDNKNKQAFPSLSYIAEHTGISRRSVAYSIQHLKQSKMMNRIRRKRFNGSFKNNKYISFKVKFKINKVVELLKSNYNLNKIEIVLPANSCKMNFVVWNFRC